MCVCVCVRERERERERERKCLCVWARTFLRTDTFRPLDQTWQSSLFIALVKPFCHTTDLTWWLRNHYIHSSISEIYLFIYVTFQQMTLAFSSSVSINHINKIVVSLYHSKYKTIQSSFDKAYFRYHGFIHLQLTCLFLSWHWVFSTFSVCVRKWTLFAHRVCACESKVMNLIRLCNGWSIVLLYGVSIFWGYLTSN